MRKVIGAFLVLLFFIGSNPPSVARAVRECPVLTTDPIGMNIEEVAGQSSDIVLGVVQNFESPNDLPNNLGYYDLDIGRTIKGGLAIGPSKVFGIEPYSHVPQHYIDATASHESNGSRYAPTEFNKVKIDNTCHLAFKGLRGYSYLLFFQEEKLWTFNVINNRQRDMLLKQVEATQKQD